MIDQLLEIEETITDIRCHYRNNITIIQLINKTLHILAK